MKTLYCIEITDTFGGEANYSWVTRHIIRAKSERGAVNALSRRSGISWHSVGSYDDHTRYDSDSGATCCFISEYDPAYPPGYSYQTDDRKAGE